MNHIIHYLIAIISLNSSCLKQITNLCIFSMFRKNINKCDCKIDNQQLIRDCSDKYYVNVTNSNS